jgi:non-specific serine/threonine protein kinase
LSQYDAVRLFVERTQAVKPDFAVTNVNAPAVAEICHRLDGLPLAIELAAAHVKVLPPQALLKRLEKRLPLLTGGARTLPARQQTMRNAIAWTHDLLPPNGQTLFRRLALFPGGCTLEAAEAMAVPDETMDVFAGISALVDMSLLRQEEGRDGEPRFRMLETVREYGLERLTAHGENHEMQQRQADWYRDLAEVAGPDLAEGRRYAEWLNRLDEEMPNLRAVITFLLETGAAHHALRLLSVSHEYWSYRWHHEEVRRWLVAAFAAAPAAPAIDRSLAHFVLVMAESMIGNNEAAANQAQLALEAAIESEDAFALGMAHFGRGLVWEFSGDGERAQAAHTEAVPHLRQSGNALFTAWVLAELGDKLVWSGKLTEAVAAIDEALALNREAGFETNLAMALGQRGHAALALKDHPHAARLFGESLTAARRIADMRIALGAVAGLAGVAGAVGDRDRSARLLGAAEAAREAARLDRIAHGLHAERITQETRAALGDASFEREWQTGRAAGVEETLDDALAFAGTFT